MKTSAWIVAAGMALGVASASLMFATPAHAAAPMGDKVDLTPKYKTGQTFTFKQHTVRTDIMTLGNVPAPKDKGEEAPPPKDAPPGEKPKSGEIHMESAQPAKDAASPAAARQALQPGGAGMSSKQSVDQTATFELRVVKADDAGVSFELELKSIVASAEIPQGKFEWDSSSPPDDKDASNPIMQSYRPIIGAITRISMSPEGAVTAVQPDERINLAGRGALAPLVQSLVGPDGVRLRWSSVLWIKDGREPASVGQTWTNVDEAPFAPASGKFVYDTKNTLKAASGGTAEIAITGDMKLMPIDAAKPVSGKLTEQSVKGSCTWDTAAGAPKSHTWEQKQTLDINAGGFDVVRKSDLSVTTTRQ